MKKLVLVTSALALSGPAFGADLPARVPVKAPMMAAPVPFSWTGCYIGGHVGYGWGQTNITDPAPVFAFANGTTQTANTRGPLAGGQVGCDYQFVPNWVIGFEGSVAWADIKGAVNDPFFAGKNFSSRTDFIADATGRIGYSFDRVLFYGKGGGAWTRNRFELPFFAGTTSASENRFGWVVGAGVEYAFAPNWSAKLEYNHYDFGSRQITLNGVGVFAGPFSAVENISQRIDTVKFGLNYRFGGGPVVARY